MTGSIGCPKEIEEISQTEEKCVNVMTVTGIGPMISTAMVEATTSNP